MVAGGREEGSLGQGMRDMRNGNATFRRGRETGEVGRGDLRRRQSPLDMQKREPQCQYTGRAYSQEKVDICSMFRWDKLARLGLRNASYYFPKLCVNIQHCSPCEDKICGTTIHSNQVDLFTECTTVFLYISTVTVCITGSRRFHNR